MLTTSRRNRPWWTLTAVALAAFMTSLDNTVVNVALPSIQHALGLDLAGLEWVASGYILVFASLLLVGGRLADLYGRRRMFLIGLSVFIAASGVAGLADGPAMLLTGRVLQGVGAALVTPTTLAIIQATFTDPKQRTRAVGVWTAIAGAALALGPLAGGWISQHLHWGWIFLINVPIGVGVLVLAALTIPESHDPAASRHLDLAGLLTSTAALSGLTYALIEGHRAGWTSPPILAAFALTATSAAAFIWVESRSRAPMVDLALIRSRVFIGGTITLMLWGLGVIGVYFFTAFYLQNVLGFSPTKAGLAFVPMAVLMIGFAPLAASVADRIGGNRTVALGMGLTAAGMLGVSLLGTDAGFADLMIPFGFVGVGSGLTMPLTANILAVLPPGRAGVASGILNTAREASGLLGVIVIGAILTTGQTAAAANDATPTAAFLHGYAIALLAAALLVAIGGVLSWATLDRRLPDPQGVHDEPNPAPALAVN